MNWLELALSIHCGMVGAAIVVMRRKLANFNARAITSILGPRFQGIAALSTPAVAVAFACMFFLICVLGIIQSF